LCSGAPRLSDIEWIEQFRQLTDEQGEQLATAALRCVQAQPDSAAEVGTRILQRLACFRDRGLSDSTLDALLAQGVFWPTSMYRDASESVAGCLVGLIDGNLGRLNHLLLAVAWTRSEAARDAFQTWSRRPPQWTTSLFVAPAEYLPAAGWRLDDAGARHDLISLDCFRLAISSDAAAADVACRIALAEKCPSCGGPQSLLFDFTRAKGQQFTGAFLDAPRRVACCLHCSCFGTVFTRYHRDGSAEWLAPIEPCRFPNDDPENCESCYRALEAACIPPFACAEPFDFSDASTLGGIPMWIQDAEFPHCLDCGRLMRFLAQHDNGPLGEEGLYYAFFCAECRVAAVTYQQT
jgi:hypothetical protein